MAAKRSEVSERERKSEIGRHEAETVFTTSKQAMESWKACFNLKKYKLDNKLTAERKGRLLTVKSKDFQDHRPPPHPP